MLIGRQAGDTKPAGRCISPWYEFGEFDNQTESLVDVCILS